MKADGRTALYAAVAISGGSAVLFGALALAGGPGGASVTVRSTPEEASVFVDGTFRGVTPVEIGDLVRGGHPVRIEKSGFKTHFGVLRIPGDGPGAKFRLERVGAGGLDVRSEPSGADVYLDGEFRGVTPLSLEGVRAGPHAVRAEKTNHDARTVSVLVPEGERAVAHVELDDRVLRYLENAAKEHPDDMLTHMELGQYYMVLGDPEKAAPAYCRATILSRRPDTDRNSRRKVDMTVKRDRARGGQLGRRLGAEFDRLLREHDSGEKR